MSDIEDTSPTLKFFFTRPRPRRNHKPSTPSTPIAFNIPSLFEDDQLAEFFPSLSSTHPSLHDQPSASPSADNSNKESLRFSSVFEEDERGGEVEGRRKCERMEELDEMQDTSEHMGVKGRMKEEEKSTREEGKDYGEEEEGSDNMQMGDRRGDENIQRDDVCIKEDEKIMNETDERGGDCGKKEEYYAMKNKEKDEHGRNEMGNEVKFSGLNDSGDVFDNESDDVSSETSINEPTMLKTPFTHFDSSSSSPLPTQPPDDTQEALSRHSTSFTPDSIPDSFTTDTCSEIQSPGMDQEEDLSMMFVYPPNLSRLGTLGSIYSHLSTPQSYRDSSSERESDTCSSPVNEEVKDSKMVPRDASDEVKEETEVESNKENNTIYTDRQDGGTMSTSNKSNTNRISGIGSMKSNVGVKKVPPPKPPRRRMPPTRRNEAVKRISREDPIRYNEITERPKRSTSMGDINENNVEAISDDRCSLFTRSPEDKLVEMFQSTDAVQDGKEHRRERCRSGGSKIKDAAKIMTSIMSKKPPFTPKFLHRKEAIRSRNLALKKVLTKDMEGPPTSPAPLPPIQDYRHDGASHFGNAPKKPPRKDLDALSKESLDKVQGTCSAHSALLHFYCVKCRVVVCRDCTVVAHSHSENHKVLDTLDSLAMLRSEAGEMLRHYTILDTMHSSLAEIYRKFKDQHRDADISAIGERLEEGKYIAGVVKEAEQMAETCTNLEQIRERVKQWEARQDDWSDLVYLASRCSLLADTYMPYDTVLLRMGNWVMPTPWIQLSHLLQPYLRTSVAPPQIPSSHHNREEQCTPSINKRKGLAISPLVARRNGNPYGGGGTNTGGTDRPFPYNARQMVLSNLVPYIILNPDIRYFMHIGGPRDVDLTLVVVPSEDHAQDCLKRRCKNATKSPEGLLYTRHQQDMDAITLVEQQMTSGSCKTRITASSLPIGPSATPTIVKVSFSDVKIVSEGHGLPTTKDRVKRGDVVVEHGQGGRPTLTVVVRDIRDYSALCLGHVTWGMDSLTCLVGTEDSRKAEISSFRAKIKATVKREEEAVYDVMFGMDL